MRVKWGSWILGAFCVGAVIGVVFGIIYESVALPAAIRASQGQGTRGVAVADEANCSSGPSGSCSWTGTFTSNDGRVHFEDVDLSGGGWSVGKPTEALYEGRSLFGVLIYPAPGSHQWLKDALVLLGASLMMILFLACLVSIIKPWVRRPGKTSSALGARHRAATDDADPEAVQES